MNIQKTSYSLGLLVAFAIGFSPVSAQAEELPARGPIPFAVYDKDGSGLISQEEFDAVRGERMATNAAEGKPMNGAAGAPSFSAFDTNGDGQLSPDELTAGQNAQRQNRSEMGGGKGQGAGMGQGMGQGMGVNMPAFSDYDLDGDGKIVETEFNEARGKRIGERAQEGYQMKNLGQAPAFSDIDVDGNGEISADEFAAHQSSRRP